MGLPNPPYSVVQCLPLYNLRGMAYVVTVATESSADWWKRARRLGITAPTIALLTGTRVRNVRAYAYGQVISPPPAFIAKVEALLASMEGKAA